MIGLALPYRIWKAIHTALLRLRLIRCTYCENTGDGCNCGAGPHIDYEIAGGRHERWCMAYHGCPACGRKA